MRQDPYPITVVFRLDDYASGSDLNAHLRILELFRKHQARCTVAVIPFRSSDMDQPWIQRGVLRPFGGLEAAKLREYLAEGVVEAALHGYCHQTLRPGPSHLEWTEFFGVPRAVQYTQLIEGRRQLEDVLGAPITSFVPPWNSYDGTTAELLDTLGFRVLSASRGRPAGPGRLALLPYTCGPWNVREAVAAARATRGARPRVVVVMIHAFEFAERPEAGSGQMAYLQLDDLLGWLKQQDEVRIATLAETAAAHPNQFNAAVYQADHPRFRTYARRRSTRVNRWMWPILGHGRFWGLGFVYPFPEQLPPGSRFAWAMISALYPALIAAAAGLAFGLAGPLRDRLGGWPLPEQGVALLGLPWLLYGLFLIRRASGYKSLALASMALGLCTGVLAAVLG